MATAILRALFASKLREVGSDGDLSILWTTVPEFLLSIRATYSPSCQYNETDVVQATTKMDVLLLDDLGAEKSTEFSWSALYVVLNDRINWLRPTIVTSNFSLAEIGKMNERIASRFASYQVIEVGGKDRRIS